MLTILELFGKLTFVTDTTTKTNMKNAARQTHTHTYKKTHNKIKNTKSKRQKVK